MRIVLHAVLGISQAMLFSTMLAHVKGEDLQLVNDMLLSTARQQHPTAVLGYLKALCYAAEDLSLVPLEELFKVHVSTVTDMIMAQAPVRDRCVNTGVCFWGNEADYSSSSLRFLRGQGPLQLRAMRFVRLVFRALSASALAGANSSENELARIAPDWIQLCEAVVQQCSNIADAAHRGSLIEVFGSLTALYSAFPEDVTTELHKVLTTSWNLLSTTTSGYVQTFVHEDSAVDGDAFGGYTSDGDRLDVEIVLVQIVELWTTIAGNPAPQVRQAFQQVLGPLTSVFVQLCQLTYEQRQQWQESPTDFVAVNEDDRAELSLRHTAANLVMELAELLGDTTAATVLAEARTAIQAAASGSAEQQLAAESALWLLGASIRHYVRHYCRKCKRLEGEALEQLEQEKAGVLSQLLEVMTTALEFKHSPLETRVWWLVSIVGRLFDPATTESTIRMAIEIMNDHSTSVATKLCAVRAFGTLMSQTATPVEIVIPMINHICALSTLTDEDTVYMLVESMTAIYTSNRDALPQEALAPGVQLVLSVWTTYGSDPLCVEVGKAALLTVAKSAAGRSVMAEMYLPQMQHILQAESTTLAPGLIEAALAVLEKLFSCADDGLRAVIVRQTLPHLTSLALNTGLGSLRAVTASCLGTFMATCFSVHSLYPAEETAAVLGSLSALVPALLTLPDGLPDHVLPNAVKYLCHLLLSCADVMEDGSVVYALNILFQRYAHTQLASAKACVVMGCVHLVARMPKGIMLLNQVSCGQQTALGVLLDAWAELHDQLVTNYTAKISAFGMLNVVDMFSSSQQAIARRIFQVALRTIGSLVVNGADAEDVDTAAANAESVSDFDDEEDGEDYDDGFGDDEYEDDDFGGAGGDDNPFAPAEDYLLSDALDENAGDLIPAATMDLDRLLYDSPRRDPLNQINSQEQLVRFVESKRAESNGELPQWIGQLKRDDQQLLQLLTS